MSALRGRAADSMGNLGAALAEIANIDRIGADLERRVEFDVHPSVEAVLRDPEAAAVLITGHVGPWTLTNFIAAYGNFPLTIVYAPESNPFVRDRILELRSALPVKLIERDNSMRALLRELPPATRSASPPTCAWTAATGCRSSGTTWKRTPCPRASRCGRSAPSFPFAPSACRAPLPHHRRSRHRAGRSERRYGGEDRLHGASPVGHLRALDSRNAAGVDVHGPALAEEPGLEAVARAEALERDRAA